MWGLRQLILQMYGDALNFYNLRLISLQYKLMQLLDFYISNTDAQVSQKVYQHGKELLPASFPKAAVKLNV